MVGSLGYDLSREKRLFLLSSNLAFRFAFSSGFIPMFFSFLALAFARFIASSSSLNLVRFMRFMLPSLSTLTNLHLLARDITGSMFSGLKELVATVKTSRTRELRDC